MGIFLRLATGSHSKPKDKNWINNNNNSYINPICLQLKLYFSSTRFNRKCSSAYLHQCTKKRDALKRRKQTDLIRRCLYTFDNLDSIYIPIEMPLSIQRTKIHFYEHRRKMRKNSHQEQSKLIFDWRCTSLF